MIRSWKSTYTSSLPVILVDFFLRPLCRLARSADLAERRPEGGEPDEGEHPRGQDLEDSVAGLSRCGLAVSVCTQVRCKVMSLNLLPRSRY